MQLRPYQIAGKLLISDLMQKGMQAILAVSPTGSGKTVTFADIANDTLYNGFKVMVLCNREELISQATHKLNSCGLYPTIIDPKYNGKVSNLYVASVDTLVNRTFPDIDLLIIDECHIRSFDKVALDCIANGIVVLGFSATPIRNGKASLEGYPNYTGQLWDVYQEMVIITTTTELLESGYLVPGIPVEPSRGKELDVKVVKTKDGLEFSGSDMFQKFDKPEMYGGVIDNYIKFGNNQPCMCFCINVEHSKRTAKEFNLRGIPAVHVDGTSKDRKKIFKDFENGKYKVLCNVAVATTGYDNPKVYCIILNRMIYSESLFIQITGRASRPSEGKDHFIYIDHGNNITRHGRWHDEREYNLDPVRMSQKRGVAPTKQCESCECIISLNTVQCPYCEYVHPVKPKSKEDEASELLQAEFEISQEHDRVMKKPVAQMTIPELEMYQKKKKYQHGWLVRQLFIRGEDALREYAKMKNYASKWVDFQVQLCGDQKQAAKDDLWRFITTNIHLDHAQVKMFSEKKLKANFTAIEIDQMLPNILGALERYRSGEIDIEGNEVINK